MITIVSVLLAMVWVLSGLFVAFLMRVADESKGADYKGGYWIKHNPDNLSKILWLVIMGPLALLLGIVVMSDYCGKH